MNVEQSILTNMTEQLTFVIPVRVDSEERISNLRTVIEFLCKFSCRIIVLEADSAARLDGECYSLGVDYEFVEDTNRVFHRTRYLNQLIKRAETEVIGVWDTDVIVDYPQIAEAFSLIIRDGLTMAFPYDGRFVMLSEQLSDLYRRGFDFSYLKNLGLKSFLGRKLCGGAYLVQKQRYLECGGENERFTGWGPEDSERWRRVQILGHKVKHIENGELYHLYHPRGANSDYQSQEDAMKLRQEFIKICSMSKDELSKYIAIWKQY